MSNYFVMEVDCGPHEAYAEVSCEACGRELECIQEHRTCKVKIKPHFCREESTHNDCDELIKKLIDETDSPRFVMPSSPEALREWLEKNLITK